MLPGRFRFTGVVGHTRGDLGKLGRALVGLALVGATLGLVTEGGASASPGAAAKASGDAKPCVRPDGGFVPVRAAIPAIDRTVRVLVVKRTPENEIGAGPLTESGKWIMAMDPVTRPSTRQGSVLLSGHTWPDGSALGNAMLEGLWTGNQVILSDNDGNRACYKITKRKSYPYDEVPGKTAFRTTGPEQIVIVACSGERTSPGHWTHRTLWYGSPLTSKPASQPGGGGSGSGSKPPPADPPSGLGGLLGGLLGGGH